MKLLVFICALLPLSTFSQIDVSGFDFSTGIIFEFGFNAKGGSYLSVAIAGGIKKNFYPDEVYATNIQRFFGRNTFAGYQASVNLYYNTIGDNIFDNFKAVNVDFTNTILATVGEYIDPINYHEHVIRVKPFNAQTPNVIFDDFMNSLSFGTNFVLNNNNRNQRVGFANFNFARIVQIHYVNDGPPYTATLGDGYDRWWTGSVGVDIHFTQYLEGEPGYLENSRISFAYDRFTGNVQDAFEAATIFGFDEVPAKNVKESLYNRSKFICGVHFFEDNFQLSYVNQGILINDIQEKIHRWRGIPVHKTNAKASHIFAVNFNNSIMLK